MKILFVCHRLPYPPNRGGKIRPFNMISHLSKRHSVTVASLAHTKEELSAGAALQEYCTEVIAEIVPDRLRWWQAVKALATSTPSSVAYFWSDRLYARIREKLESANFDLIFVHCAFVAQYVLDWDKTRRIIDFGDLDSAKWAEYSRTRGFPLALGYAIEARKLRKYEASVARRFKHCTVTTQGEMEEFNALETAVPCDLIPNGVDIAYFSMNGTRKEVGSVIAFLGRMDYYPNINAVMYFVEQIFPRIRQLKPDAQFRIIGSNPAAKIRALAKLNGISVTGHVPDVRPYLADAMISVAPLRIARGTQNKVLESMAMGIPVVTTSQAAKGIQAIPGKHLLVADGPENFAAQVIELLDNPRLRRELSEAGRRQVEAAHVWRTSMQKLDGLLAKTVSNNSTASAIINGNSQGRGRVLS
jgi:sugar transferase (PEP-CTERM/EpsH1 system associated)